MMRRTEWADTMLRQGVASLAIGLWVATALSGADLSSPRPELGLAAQILEVSGVHGGLVVHLGCGEGRLTAALHANDRYLVQGLERDQGRVEQARAQLQSWGLYGPVSVARYDGQELPYVRDTVNLLVIEDAEGGLREEEIKRVLAPGGVAVRVDRDVRRPEAETVTLPPPGQSPRVERLFRRPRSADVDEWSHFLHDASGNAVANDREVGPPKSLRWVAEPRWSRSHEIPSSVNAVVAAGGRIFMIFDEAPTGVFARLPQHCQLVARDAANGVLLWKTPMLDWQPEFGTGEGGRWAIHHTIPRRLVAAGDRVYVTLRFLDSPVSVLNAATGEVLVPALEGTQGADELLLADGVLIVKITQGRSVAASARLGKDSLNDTLVAVDVQTGKPLWRKEKTRVVPYALSALAGRVVYHNLDELVCLEARTGREMWRVPNGITSTVGAASTLVLHDGVVLFHGHGQAAPAENASPAPSGSKKKAAKNKPANPFYLTALALEDGRLLWRRNGSPSLAAACTQPTDVFVAKGVVWCGSSLDGVDLKSGEVRHTLSLEKLISPGHHYRCHRAKATEEFMIWPKRGAEFVDLEGSDHMRNDWLRAPCFTGLTPANGLLYVPPSQCFCYPGVKVAGYLALSADTESSVSAPADSPAARLERGPAYRDAGATGATLIAGAEDWPMHRRDAGRSGSTKTVVPVDLAPQWELQLAAPATQPVLAGQQVWVAEKDMHRLRCLQAADGQEVWSYTAGGRIDSAPTVQDGRVYFGCRDGSVVCLRAADGALVWRFQAAPDRKQVVSFGQLESAWPVHGSVLVQDGVVYGAAGRSSFLDGGIAVYGLDAKTGRVLHQHALEGPWPDISQDTGEPFAMEGALPDLLVSDGRDLYMQRIKFDARLNRLHTIQESSLGELDMGAAHLVATGGFLDDTGFDRLYWMHSHRWPGFYFSQFAPKSGQLVVFDEQTAYAVKYFYRRITWSPAFYPGDQGYLLFADDIGNEPALEDASNAAKTIAWLPKDAASDAFRRGGRGVEKGTGYVRQQPAQWQTMIPLRIRAMVLAGDRLFAVGLPDVVDPADPLASFEGRQGALLQVFSAADGGLLKSYPLPSPPVFDGLSAAHGRLYLATADGKLLCFGAAGGD